MSFFGFKTAVGDVSGLGVVQLHTEMPPFFVVGSEPRLLHDRFEQQSVGERSTRRIFRVTVCVERIPRVPMSSGIPVDRSTNVRSTVCP